MQDRIVEKLVGILLSALLGTGGCLSTGCIGHGSRTIDIELFGQSIVIKDTVSLDSDGETKFARTFDPEAWKLLFGWLVPENDQAVDEPEAPPEP